MNTVNVRRMAQADIPEVVGLERQAFSEPWSKQGFAGALAMKHNLFFVAETPEGHIVGYIGLYVSGEEAEIVKVAVDGNERREGIGERLIEEAQTSAAQRGVSQLYLEVRASNEAAIRLYKKCGYQPCGMRKDFYLRPREDAVCMHRELN